MKYRQHQLRCLSRLFFRQYHILGNKWNPTRVQYTKYRITKPWSLDSKYDDIFLAEPSKDDFYKTSKEVPVFLRFLNLITMVEKRPHVFREFAQRCEDGLVVEKDVYITKQELLDNMWQNGFTDKQMNAFKYAFPDDYKFHYPELAVLFDLSEEDCYKYCIKMRASNPEELVQLNFKSPKNLVSTYGLVFLGCWFGLCNTVLGNAWFFAKTLPFGAVFYMLAYYYQRTISEYFAKDQKLAIDKANEDKLSSEDAVYSQIKKYSDDSNCHQYVTSLKETLPDLLNEFHVAVLALMKDLLKTSMLEKLNSIAQQQDSISLELQRNMAEEVVAFFRNKFAKDTALQNNLIDAAIKEIEHEGGSDPVVESLVNILKDIQTGSSPLSSKLDLKVKEKERDFVRSYSVRREEVETIAKIKQACTDSNGDINVSKLSSDELEKLQSLYDTVHSRLGIPISSLLETVPQLGGGKNQYTNIFKNLKEVNLNNFLTSF